MTKVKITDLRDPLKKISVGPMTEDQHAKLVKAVGYGKDWREAYSYRFYQCGLSEANTHGLDPRSYLLYPGGVATAHREVSFSEIDFEERPFHYVAPCDMDRWKIKKGERVTKVRDVVGEYYLSERIEFPPELVEHFFEKEYEPATIELNGWFTKQQLIELAGGM